MRILVAVDKDLESRLALRYACHLVEHTEAEVDAIHVKKDVGNIMLEDFDIPFLKKDHQAKADKETKEVEQAINDACDICFAGKVPCEPRVLTGAPAEVILSEAQDKDVDLIVLGCHSSSAVREMLLGQVHSQVIHHADRPVLIVRELRNIHRVLVAYSGSSCDESALNFLGPMLLRKKPQITLMHVQDTTDEESREYADACLLKGESTLKKLEHMPEMKFAEGDVVEEVVREIALDNYDLVVLGAKGFQKTGRFNILSEKALQIIRRTTRPVLLYRQKA